MQCCKYELGNLWLTSASYKHPCQSIAENRDRNSTVSLVQLLVTPKSAFSIKDPYGATHVSKANCQNKLYLVSNILAIN